MTEQWEKALACATACTACGSSLTPRDTRVLSVTTHEPICMPCKQKEEARPDCANTSKRMISD